MEYLNWWNEHTYQEITGLEKKEIRNVTRMHRMDFSEVFKIVEADAGAYWNTKNKVDANLIMRKFVDAQGNSKVTMDTAKRIASILNVK
jgi:S-ribosylhomocysteine lyase LuxS involved in autoinducer biosynthesis